MKWFTEPSGKFVIKIPTEWQYANVAYNYEEVSPFSFELYNTPVGAFQISCYVPNQPAIESKKNQKANTNNLKFTEWRMDGDGFNVHLWGANVEDHIFLAKYIYDTNKANDPVILEELKKTYEALGTVQLLSEDKRKLAHDLDKHEKFMASLAASFDLKSKALENASLIEVSIITANQIDAYLRLCLVLKAQLTTDPDELYINYLYQDKNDTPKMERKIYQEAKDAGILDTEIFNELEVLYKKRNEMVHRYIISEFRSRDLIEIAYNYEVTCEKVRLILRKLETEQFKKRIGTYKDSQTLHVMPSAETLKLLHAQVNDKHLLKVFERNIKNT